jgi:hypothetical protein
MHRYGYADGDPVSRRDPTGLMTLSEGLIYLAIAGGLLAFAQGMNGLLGINPVTWDGPTAAVGISGPASMGFSIGITRLDGRRGGLLTEALHLIVATTFSSPNYAQNALQKASAGKIFASGVRGIAFLLVSFLTYTPIDISFGSSTLRAPKVFGGATGLRPRALAGGYFNVGASINTGLIGAAVAEAVGNANGRSFNGNYGISATVQGFGVGWATPFTEGGGDKTDSLAISASASVAFGLSIPVTPPDWVEQSDPSNLVSR